VSDITYIPTAEGWLYLAVVIDLFSRSVLGWKLSESLHSDLVTAAISRALDTASSPAARSSIPIAAANTQRPSHAICSSAPA
jgi:transposase InsO family protein